MEQTSARRVNVTYRSKRVNCVVKKVVDMEKVEADKKQKKAEK